MSQLIYCPSCYKGGVTRVVGAISDNGGVVIQRQRKNWEHKGESDTIIDGTNFELRCGACGNVVYRKRESAFGLIQIIERVGTYTGTFNSSVGTFAI